MANNRRDDGGDGNLGWIITMASAIVAIAVTYQALAVSFGTTAARYAAAIAADAQRSYTAAPGDGQAAAENYLAQFGGFLSSADIDVDSDGQEVTVTVTGSVIDLVPGHDWEVSRTSSGQIEQFTEAS